MPSGNEQAPRGVSAGPTSSTPGACASAFGKGKFPVAPFSTSGARAGRTPEFYEHHSCGPLPSGGYSVAHVRCVRLFFFQVQVRIARFISAVKLDSPKPSCKGSGCVIWEPSGNCSGFSISSLLCSSLVFHKCMPNARTNRDWQFILWVSTRNPASLSNFNVSSWQIRSYHWLRRWPGH